MTQKTLLSFGHGYSAQALAAILIPQGWRVIGTTRSAARAAQIRGSGAEALIWPDDDMIPALDAATHILTSAEPGTGGDPILARLQDQIAARAGRYDWVGYLSTTGVYGDHGGAVVTEDSATVSTNPRSVARLAAERDWLAIPGLPVHVFRLAGIYGPGRGPFQKVLDGTARRIMKPGQIFSRIHVDDIGRTLAASIARPDPARIYNVCDDEPAPNHLVIEEAARLLGVEPPPAVDFDKADLSPMARSFYMESRAVSNARLRRELGVDLAYPDYRSGLAALLAAENSSSAP